MKHETELIDFLLQVFDIREFSSFVRDGPDGRKLAPVLKTLPAGKRESFTEVVRALDRRGLIDRPFFNRLLEERPRFATVIAGLQRSVIGTDLEPKDRYYFDFFISSSSRDYVVTDRLYQLLTESGARVFFDRMNIRLGQAWDREIENALESSRFVVALISHASLESQYATTEWQWAIRQFQRSGQVTIVPVLIGEADWSDLPPYLRDIQALDARNQPLEIVAERLLELLKKDSSEFSPPQSMDGFADTSLRDLALQFFKAAGRGAQTVGPAELSIPEPAWAARYVPPSPSEARQLARLLDSGQIGYFLYKGGLPEDTLLELDNIRIKGNPIVPISEGTMTAALADNTSSSVLLELETNYRGTDNFFETRNALIDERFLFGRAELLAQVGSALARGEHILVFGLRKAGKTSFLNILRQHLARHPFSSIDLQKYDRHKEDWPPLLFQQLVGSFDSWGRAEFQDWPGTGSDGTIASTSELEKALQKRRAWQIERGRNERFIVVLDEIERILPDRSKSDEVRQFVRASGALRSLGQAATGRFVSIIAADLRPDVNRINRLGESDTNPFFSFFQELPLPLLSAAAIEEMVRSIGRAMGINTVSQGFVQQLNDLGGGHPFISRLMAGAAYRKRHDKGELTEMDLSRGLSDLDDKDVGCGGGT